MKVKSRLYESNEKLRIKVVFKSKAVSDIKDVLYNTFVKSTKNNFCEFAFEELLGKEVELYSNVVSAKLKVKGSKAIATFDMNIIELYRRKMQADDIAKRVLNVINELKSEIEDYENYRSSLLQKLVEELGA